MEPARELWRTYDAIAENYRETNPAGESIGSALVEYADPPRAARLLDAGAGRGAVARAAVQRGCAVTAVDAAPRMVELLAAELPAATVRRMDVTGLGFPAASFDVVTGGYLLDVLDDPAAAACELRRVLVPGGVLALSEPCPVRQEWVWLHRLACEFWPRPDPDEAARQRNAAHQRVITALRGAGFISLRQRRYEHPVRCTADEVWRSWGLHSATESLDAGRAVEFRARFAAGLGQMGADGLVLHHDAVLYRAIAPAG